MSRHVNAISGRLSLPRWCRHDGAGSGARAGVRAGEKGRTEAWGGVKVLEGVGAMGWGLKNLGTEAPARATEGRAGLPGRGW